ncbi:cytochrome b reductase [Hyphodiscus hymeniophilus]|uniref:NADH-cytochrome b5 reductase n=1 Tax=Hyphodiscus hymeniophilus TaxID=353542 RepID=A0A9P6VH45_9HELO|nr:cytochrome b reductase [Hyphodiscus hymeniophilus]
MSAQRILQPIRNRPLVAAGAITAIGMSVWVTKSCLVRDVHAESPSQQPPKVFSGFGGQSLRLESSNLVNHNTKRLRFEFPNSEAQSGLTLTSSVLTIAWPQGRWFPVLRPYTPISSIDEPGSLELLVKRYPNGKASGYLHSLTPGSTLLMVGLGGYKWIPNSFPHVTLIAGGAGITPIYQLTRGILRNPDDRTRITLVHGINTDADLLLREEFEDLERRFPGRFRWVVTVSKPVEGSPFRRGYVNKELLEEVGSGKRSEEKVFVCGPPPMETALTAKRGVLEELGYRKDQIVKF